MAAVYDVSEKRLVQDAVPSKVSCCALHASLSCLYISPLGAAGTLLFMVLYYTGLWDWGLQIFNSWCHSAFGGVRGAYEGTAHALKAALASPDRFSFMLLGTGMVLLLVSVAVFCKGPVTLGL